MSETTPPAGGPGIRTGGIKAGSIRAVNVVDGVQIQGADAATVQALLAQRLESGGIEVLQELIATNVVTGLQYLGQAGSPPTREQFQQELRAVQTQLTAAVQAGEIADPDDAEDAQKAVTRALAQSQEPQPVAERLLKQIDQATTIVSKAASAAEAAEKFQAVVVKLAPIFTVLKNLVGTFF
ncbi:MAG: hypothetical protein AB7N91_03965 [Candidatus Tectimicrobiota bacterium]